MHDPAGRETADERLRTQLIVLLPTLLGEIRAAGSILKEAHLRRERSVCAATADVPEDIANEMRAASAAADGKQYFSCCQTITHATRTLHQLEEDIRRSLDSSGRQTLMHDHARRRWCSYLEQALDLLYALNWELHLVRLATNALYVHAQDDAPAELQLQETDGLQDAIGRLLAAIATKHFGPPTPPVDQ
uniref:Uncharacterized protein n=1 Tax=Anopheles farauti TaxID=69004 RepID=A0A182QU18_9DIPT